MGDEYQVVCLSVLDVVLEPARAEHGHEGKRGGHGDYHDDADYPSQLLEHDSGHAADHGQWQEHAEHREGGRHYGDAHLGSSVHGGLLGFSPLDMCVVMFSSTTMESSTTIPIAMENADIEMMFSVLPVANR